MLLLFIIRNELKPLLYSASKFFLNINCAMEIKWNYVEYKA